MYLLLCMIFCHILGDYTLQGVLASMKQKSHWEGQHAMYKYDYIAALICHAFSWAFMIMLPIVIYTTVKSLYLDSLLFGLVFGLNLAIHACIDNAKANKKIINLVEDQFFHLVQIICTWAIFMYF